MIKHRLIFLFMFLFVGYSSSVGANAQKPDANAGFSNPAPSGNPNIDSIVAQQRTLMMDEKLKHLSDYDDQKITDALKHYYTSKTLHSFEFILALMVLIFGILLFTLYYKLFKTGRLTSHQITRLNLLTLIVLLTVLLIIVGYDNNQIAPVIGLFGTIAGYLLGKSPSPGADEDSKSVDPKAKDPKTADISTGDKNQDDEDKKDLI